MVRPRTSTNNWNVSIKRFIGRNIKWCLASVIIGSMLFPYFSMKEISKQAELMKAAVSTSSSKSSKWRLWHDMTPEEQKESLQRISVYVKKYGALMQREQSKFHYKCETKLFGKGGEHMLCGPAPKLPCYFVSFGINKDPSFDLMLAEEWKCRGFAADPTVTHQSKLHPLVTFHNLGLTTLYPNEEKNNTEEEWWYTSMPELRKFLKLDYIDIVKLDCEGCEISFSRDIIAEDPDFLKHVGQISIETHASRAWIDTHEALYYFGLLFALLEEAGFELVWSSVFRCNKRHERYGCLPEFNEWGFSCGENPPLVTFGKSCHDFLFLRVDKK
jgi:hypothetical protein